jgi:penicillin-binding protein 2
MSFLGQEEEIREFQHRFKGVYFAVFAAGVILAMRLFYLQIYKGDQMRQYSEENRIKKVKITAPRGMVFDRNHHLLLDNKPSFDLELIPQYLKEQSEQERVIKLLADLLKTKPEDLKEAMTKYKYQPSFLPIKLKRDLSLDEVALINAWKIELPGVQIQQEIKRTSTHGDVAAHLLGYIGEVAPNELTQLNKEKELYKLGDMVGKFGIEQKLEPILRGKDGERLVEVDALGRIKFKKDESGRLLANEGMTQASPGKNIVLTIDQDVQNVAAKAFEDKAGAAVAIDPQTGQVLAMISRPAFDSTQFARGIPAELWNELITNERRPLRDKTIQDHYPPGSVFKTVTLIAGLEEGAITPQTKFFCPGRLTFGNRVFHCHKKEGHGEVGPLEAISKSCDVFFYKTAMALGSVDKIAKWAHLLGLGKRTGIPLPREVPGLIPTTQWKQDRYKQKWNEGETLSVAIGQGYVNTTIIQLATMYASIANGGTHYKPYFVKEVDSMEGEILEEAKPEILDNFRFKPTTYEILKKGLWSVVNTQMGTMWTNRLPGMDFAGKTGTAQVINLNKNNVFSKCENMIYKNRHHGLFAGFAPIENPRIAVAVIAEHACHGATGAGPIAKAMVKTYLEKIDPEHYSPKAIEARLALEKKQGKLPPILFTKPDASNTTEDQVPDVNTPVIPLPNTPLDD